MSFGICNSRKRAEGTTIMTLFQQLGFKCADQTDHFGTFLQTNTGHDQWWFVDLNWRFESTRFVTLDSISAIYFPLINAKVGPREQSFFWIGKIQQGVWNILKPRYSLGNLPLTVLKVTPEALPGDILRSGACGGVDWFDESGDRGSLARFRGYIWVGKFSEKNANHMNSLRLLWTERRVQLRLWSRMLWQMQPSKQRRMIKPSTC